MPGRARDYFEANEDGEGWADYQESQCDPDDADRAADEVYGCDSDE